MTRWSLAMGPWSSGPEYELTKVVKGWKASAKRTDSSTITFDIDGFKTEAAAVQELVSDVWLYCDGVVALRGRVSGSGDTLDGNGHAVNFSAGDYRAVLARRMIWDNWSRLGYNVDPTTNAWQLLARAQEEPAGSYGIVRGAFPALSAPIDQIKHDAGTFVAAEIDANAKLGTGFDWDITSPSELGLQFDTWRPGRGQVTDVVLEYGENVSASRQVDPSTYANSVRYPGGTDADNNQLPAVRRDASDIATRPEGRWELGVGGDATNITTNAGGNALADHELAQAQILQPSYTVNLTAGFYRGPTHFWLGDTVTLQIRSGRLLIDQQMSVEQIDITGTADEDEPSVAVTLGAYTIEQRQLRRLRDINRRLSALERR